MIMFIYEHKSLGLGEKGPSPELHSFHAKWASK